MRIVRWLRPRRERISAHEMTCQQAFGLVMDYLDGNLADAERARFERHLVECPPCTEHVKQVQLVVAVTGQIRNEDVDPLAREDLLNLYRRWRDDPMDDPTVG